MYVTMQNRKQPRVTASPARQDTDEVLLMDLAQGNLAALDTLYMRYARPVFSLAMRVVGNTADAEEVTQDVFEQVWRHAARFDPARGQAGTWLMSITAHVALDAGRKQQRRPTTRRDTHTEMSTHHIPDGALDVCASTIQNMDAHQIRRALSSLPQPQRHVIALTYFGGLSQSEIAIALNAPLGTIKARLRRGMVRLRETVDAYGLRPEAAGEAALS